MGATILEGYLPGPHFPLTGSRGDYGAMCTIGTFSQFGTVQSAQIIVDRDTNRSKGFGFVEMGSDAEAQAAIQGLDGRDHDGRNLTVNEAKPREARPSGGGYGGGGGGGGGYGGGRGGGGGYGGGGSRY